MAIIDMPDTWAAATTTNTLQWNASGSNLSNTYVVSMAPVEAAPPLRRAAETALEWLDRRVAEIRLPLAA